MSFAGSCETLGERERERDCKFVIKWLASSPPRLLLYADTHRFHKPTPSLPSTPTSKGIQPACYVTAIQNHARILKSGYGTYPSLLLSIVSAYVHCNRFNLLAQLLEEIPFWGIDLVDANVLITSLMKAGGLHVANRVFDKMPVRDVVTWNSMISGCLRSGYFPKALRLFRKMLRANVEPDGFTFSSVISACARAGSAKHGEWVHSLMNHKGIELNFILSAALIDMYAKSGKLKASKEVFDSVRRNHVSVWNAMINGLAIHGRASGAIAIFSRMGVENVSPDSITFVGILTACSRCGLVDQGQKYFDLMTRHYSVEPELEHYGAMVDLLARAGLLEEAYSVIESMAIEPDVIIWRTILSACRIHRNPELGKVAIQKISGLKSGDYVLLSNIYCSMSNWDSAERVRDFMRKKKVRKNHGRSWVEVAGVIHQFKAGDRSHPERESIFKVLEWLTSRAKLEGFMPTTELVLMDVTEEEKEENLNCHSEKLALVYGVLKSSPGSEIMVSKNLRTCSDCHCWMKIVSRVLGRVIIVRDRIRFHRFEAGLCSCGDYW